MSALPEPLQVVQRLIVAFNALGIDYMVGGPVARSVVGVERATQDVDFVLALTSEQVTPLVTALEEDFYANVIHLPTMVKADLFILPNTPFAASQAYRMDDLQRRERYHAKQAAPSRDSCSSPKALAERARG